MLELSRALRTLVSLAITSVVLANGVVASLLERELPAGATVEAQHDGQRCPAAHDHGICVQLQQARSLPIRPQQVPLFAAVAVTRTPGTRQQSLTGASILPSRARAPPIL